MTEEKKQTNKSSKSTKSKRSTYIHETRKREREQKTSLNAILITFTVLVLAVFFGAQLIAKTGIFYQPCKIIFADSATELNRDFINTNLDPAKLMLAENLTVGAISSTETVDETNFLLYDVLVPTEDFYGDKVSVTSAEAEAGNLISIWDLDNSNRLLAIDDHYYLDDFNKGAFFQYLTFSGNAKDIATVKQILQAKIAPLPTRETVLTLAQTGVTALSRRMYDKLLEVEDASYFSAKIAPFLQNFDLTHTSNEASFSKSANNTNICAAPAMLGVIKDVGFDIIELTGNHNQDCGDQDAINTITTYHDLGIKTFGGGIDSEAAAEPLTIHQKNTNITLLGYNLSTGGYTLDDTPGANFYTPEKAQQDIKAAKSRGDFVIVDVQYYECPNYVDEAENTTCDYANSTEGDQVALYRELIDMGADIVVGTAAHQPQTYEQYHDGAIYYGLGNLFFDQSRWPGTRRSLILIHYFWQGKLIQTRLVPTTYDDNFQTAIMSPTEASKLLQRLSNAKPIQ